MKQAPLVLAISAALLVPATASEPSRPPPGPDGDGDGVVTLAEFRTFRSERAFANDDDGRLSLEEFRPMLPARVPSLMHGRAFRRVDADGDGRVSPEELDVMPTRAFDEADADADGRVAGHELDAFRRQ